MNGSVTSDPEQLLAASRERQVSGLTSREQLVEVAVGGGFVAASAVLVLSTHGAGIHWASLIMAVLALAAASRVTFEVGSTYTVPLELVFVPMLFVLPAAYVPAAVAVALMLGKLPEVLRGPRPAGRLLMAPGDSWFAVGPALVFVLASPGAPNGHEWPVYVLALGAQLLCDFTSSSLREHLNGGASLKEQLLECRWVYLVDITLAAPALAIAFAAWGRSWVLLLVLPLTALMAVFARERRARMDYVLELSRAYRGTALVLGDVVEADDAYTGRHSEAVVGLAVEVADEMRLSSAARRNVEFGALLHDVGKIAVPKEIINKPGPLDDEEWTIMRLHTIAGQDMLEQIGGFMREVGTIVRGSHERYDGGGYPDGLVGEQIPLESRIISCCDAFNAMTTDRSYRRARSERDAVEELRRCSGSQFDPVVVDAVVTVVERRLRERPEGGESEITLTAPAATLSETRC